MEAETSGSEAEEEMMKMFQLGKQKKPRTGKGKYKDHSNPEAKRK